MITSRCAAAAALALALALALAPSAHAQLGLFSKEQRSAITADWTGERFPDGRPKVPQGLLDRMKQVTAEEAWASSPPRATSCSSRAAGRRSTPARPAGSWVAS